MNTPLDDGRYDAFILWAQLAEDVLRLECTITAGAHRGEVVNIASALLSVHDELDLIGMPCTLVVRDDAIRIEFE